MDWTAHFLEGGRLVYAFNIIDYAARDICGLWQGGFWKRHHVRSLAHVQRTNPEFERWYRES